MRGGIRRTAFSVGGEFSGYRKKKKKRLCFGLRPSLSLTPFGLLVFVLVLCDREWILLRRPYKIENSFWGNLAQ